MSDTTQDLERINKREPITPPTGVTTTGEWEPELDCLMRGGMEVVNA